MTGEAGGRQRGGRRPRPVVIIGNLTIDDVIQADGSSQMGTLGGNTVHAAAAALTWTPAVGVVARCGADFPAGAIDRLRAAGADTTGVRSIDWPDGPELGHLRSRRHAAVGVPDAARAQRAGGAAPR